MTSEKHDSAKIARENEHDECNVCFTPPAKPVAPILGVIAAALLLVLLLASMLVEYETAPQRHITRHSDGTWDDTLGPPVSRVKVFITFDGTVCTRDAVGLGPLHCRKLSQWVLRGLP